jgi:hypothetical protein
VSLAPTSRKRTLLASSLASTATVPSAKSAARVLRQLHPASNDDADEAQDDSNDSIVAVSEAPARTEALATTTR